MKQIFRNGQQSHGGDRKTFEVMTSTLPIGTIGSVASLLAATLYQGNPDRESTCPSGNSCYSELPLYKYNLVCWSSIIQISSLSNVTTFRHDIHCS